MDYGIFIIIIIITNISRAPFLTGAQCFTMIYIYNTKYTTTSAIGMSNQAQTRMHACTHAHAHTRTPMLEQGGT